MSKGEYNLILDQLFSTMSKKLIEHAREEAIKKQENLRRTSVQNSQTKINIHNNKVQSNKQNYKINSNPHNYQENVGIKNYETGIPIICGYHESLCLGTKQRFIKPQAITNIGAKVYKAVCSRNHTILLLEDGRLFGAGNNYDGQLDATVKEHHIYNFIPIKPNRRFRDVSVGYDYTVAIATDGEVYGFGGNYCITQKNECDQHLIASFKPLMPGHKFSMVACGYKHFLLLDKDGKLFVLGLNYYGQIGMGDDVIGVIRPALIMENKTFSYIACGPYNSAAIEKNGDLYTWGDNDNGQLGCGSMEEKIYQPQKVASGVIAVSCGGYHSAIIDKNYQLSTCGENDVGQLCDGTYNNERVFKPRLNGKQIAFVECGGNYTMIVDIKGNLYGCGSNKFGQLGNGQISDKGDINQVIMTNVLRVGCGPAESVIIRRK